MLVTEITAKSIDEALRQQLDALNTSVESREVVRSSRSATASRASTG